MVSVSKVTGLGFAAVSIAVMIFVLLSGITDDEQRVNKVVLEVIYGGSFKVTVTENGRESVLSGYGFVRTSLVLGGEAGVISVSVEKLDAGNGTLYLYFKTVDGEVLVSDSTSEPMGTASVSLIL